MLYILNTHTQVKVLTLNSKLYSIDFSDDIGIQTSGTCTLSTSEVKQSGVEEDMAVPKVTICGDELPNNAVGQDRLE